MGCQACENVTIDLVYGVYYYRWGAANIGVIGCEKHVKEMFVVLNDYQYNKNNIKEK